MRSRRAHSSAAWYGRDSMRESDVDMGWTTHPPSRRVVEIRSQPWAEPGAYTLPLPYRDPLRHGPLRWRRWRAADILTVVIALLVWRIFFPALMSQDSLVQYRQALAGRYDDWHPPLMAIVLHLVLLAGGGLGLLMLAQCLAGVFGLRALASEAIRALWPGRHDDGAIAWRSLLVLALLLLPLSPLAFYLMTFWKDAWAAVVLIWLGAAVLRIVRLGSSPRRLAGVLALAAALGMLRHNAVIALPLVGVGLCQAVRAKGAARIALLGAAPLACFVVANAALDRAFAVEKMHHESAVMVLDLIGLCASGATVCHELAWTESHVRDRGAIATYQPGDMGLVFWRPTPTVDLSMRTDPRLREEYLHAIRRFPLALARLKVRGFVTLLGLRRTYYFFHPSIIDNPEGLVLNERFAALRAWLVQATGRAGAHPLARWWSGVHAVWIATDAAWIVALLVAGWRLKRHELVTLALVLTVPLAYYLSYLLAMLVEDFRFMYPSTLFVQCVTLAALVGGVQKPTGRAPYLRTFSA
jgi:hypothetical protein